MRSSLVSPDGDDQLFFVTSYSDFEKLGKIRNGFILLDAKDLIEKHGVLTFFRLLSASSH